MTLHMLFRRQLEFVGTVPFNGFHTLHLDLTALFRVVDQRPVKIGGLRCRFRFRWRVGFGVVASEEGPHFPALRAVISLESRLTVEAKLEAALVRPLHRHHERKFDRLGATDVDLTCHRQRIDSAPGLKAAACRDIALDDLCSAHVCRRQRTAGRRGQSVSGHEPPGEQPRYRDRHIDKTLHDSPLRSYVGDAAVAYSTTSPSI
ncbi:hypothetical protein LMG28138_06041 [Pararobbsia alpina]|uniref:Uncharacterized protein n=1 Tax=Pararobbsia alpina TaxID=621374 RepID=A0A6S7BPK4_9BURK|nr:hypothetical protein LMG28138_06041 [Pararobbsia alpina]